MMISKVLRGLWPGH